MTQNIAMQQKYCACEVFVHLKPRREKQKNKHHWSHVVSDKKCITLQEANVTLLDVTPNRVLIHAVVVGHYLQDS